MTITEATEFLTKQLDIQKETVTFRWLSRELSIHVNAAKNEMASFYASSQATDKPLHATFLLTGDVLPIKAAGSYRDDDETDMDVEDITTESVTTSRIILVGEDELEAAKLQFTRKPSVHIYSLSPSAIKDAALLAPMADRVRPSDISKGKAYNQTIGIVVGQDVKVGHASKSTTITSAKAYTSASSSKSNLPVEKKTASKPRSSEKGKTSEGVKQDEKKKGTLDWSKAKVKVDKRKEMSTVEMEKVIKSESKVDLKEKGAESKVHVKEREAIPAKVKKEPEESNFNSKVDGNVVSYNPKRGTKRPSAVMSLSDTEDEHSSPETKPRTFTSPVSFRPASKVENGVKVKRNALLSDEETTEKVRSKPAKKGKGRAVISDDEEEADRSVRAMMDLDDSEVTRHNQVFAPDEHESDESDVEMLSDPIPARPKVKRKFKKVVPKGQNGLPKRRVVKSKKTKNAKGYTITEDYSSYESVSESEQMTAPSDAEKKLKRSKKPKENSASARMSPSGNTGVSKSRTSVKPKREDHTPSMEVKGAISLEETKLESKKSGSTSGAKASNGNKSDLMSYFSKK